MQYEKDFYTISEVAALLGLSKVAVWQWVRKGKIGATRLHPSAPYLISREEVLRAKGAVK